MVYQEIVERIGEVVEFVGVIVIVVGIVVSLIAYVRTWLPKGTDDARFSHARRSIGRSILLGLEVLVAGDIIRTVAVDPSFTSVGVLAGIVLIRTFLSFTLELEITGRWPWNQSTAARAAGHGAGGGSGGFQ